MTGRTAKDPQGSLAGMRIGIACSAMKAGKLAAGLEALGARVLPLPVISIRALDDTSSLDTALDRLRRYDWVIFTSAHGVHYFLSRMGEQRRPIEDLQDPKVCAVGPSTAAALRKAGIRVSLIPKSFDAEGILEAFGRLGDLRGLRVLLPRAKDARDLLPRELTAAGALVDDVPCYENILPRPDPSLLESLHAEPLQLIVFTSSSTVRNFVSVFGKEGERLLLGSNIAVIGPVTAETAASYGKRPEIMPEENTIPSLLEAIAKYFQQRREATKP